MRARVTQCFECGSGPTITLRFAFPPFSCIVPTNPPSAATRPAHTPVGDLGAVGIEVNQYGVAREARRAQHVALHPAQRFCQRVRREARHVVGSKAVLPRSFLRAPAGRTAGAAWAGRMGRKRRWHGAQTEDIGGGDEREGRLYCCMCVRTCACGARVGLQYYHIMRRGLWNISPSIS